MRRLTTVAAVATVAAVLAAMVRVAVVAMVLHVRRAHCHRMHACLGRVRVGVRGGICMRAWGG